MHEVLTDVSDLPDVNEESPSVDRRRRWPWITGISAIAAVAAWSLIGGSSGGEVADEVAELRFADVVTADLVEESTFGGTLGRTQGDPITTAFAGTVTAAATPGDTVEQGKILYEIDREPVPLLYGDFPMYRSLTSSAEDTTVTARNSGTITWAPEVGRKLVEGDILMWIDDEPIVLLNGETPAFRSMADERTDIDGSDVLQLETALVRLFPDSTISVDGTFTSATANLVEDWQESIGASETGRVNLGSVVFLPGPTEITSVDVAVGDVVTSGRALVSVAGDELMTADDVLQLEAALVALGFGVDVSVDGVFDAATTAAVVEFQIAVGMEPDGRIDLGDVVFRSGAVRVNERLTSVGSTVNAGGQVLAVTASDILITVDLPAADQDALSPGDEVTVELPDGTLTPGVVESVSSVATQNPNAGTTFDTTVLLNDPAVAGDLDEAPVEVHVVSDSVTNVMAVPVTSLLALREGGYAVEVGLADGTTTLVAVEPGFFADGLVEVTSDVL